MSRLASKSHIFSNNMFNKKSALKVVTYSTNVNWKDLPWDTLAKECDEEQVVALETARASRLQAYNNFIQSKVEEWEALNPEAPFEGNFSEQHPFPELSRAEQFRVRQEANKQCVTSFLERIAFKSYAMNVLPQIIEHVASFGVSRGKLVLETVSGGEYDPKLAELSLKEGNTDNLISGVCLYKKYFTRSDQDRGLYNFLTHDVRSNYLDVQYKHPGKTYCSLVPLILYAFKLKHAVPYRHWHRPDVRGLVNQALADAMLCDNVPELSKDEILEARNTALTIKSGAGMGKMRNPSNTYKLYGSHAFYKLPSLVGVMLAQIWCAHPSNRTKYMVLDPKNWDNIPAPLIAEEVTIAQVPWDIKGTGVIDNDAPW